MTARHRVTGTAIILAVDQSPGVESAVRVAGVLADALGACARMVHVFEESPPITPAQLKQSERERELAGERARALFLALRERLPPDTAVEESFLVGLADDVLISLSRDAGAAMLVVGSRGRSGLKSAVLGSVSRRVATESAVPVVVVPPSAAALELGGDLVPTVVCGVDGSDESTEAARFAAELAARLALELVVTHVVDMPPAGMVPAASGTDRVDQASLADRRREQALEVARRAQSLVGAIVPTHARAVAGEPAGSLDRVAQELHGQLIVVGSRGRGRIAGLLGSVSAKLGAEASRPVAVVPAGSAARFLSRVDTA